MAYTEGQRLQGSDGKIYVVHQGVPHEEAPAAPAQAGPPAFIPGVPKAAPPPKPFEPPSGYQGTPDHLAPIPGGPADKPDKADAPYSQSALDAFDRAIASAERLKRHPGLSAMVGSGFDPASWGSFSPLPFTDRETPFAGTKAADFKGELDAMKAQVFLPMVQSMKGMGALSNAEGEKLTAAIGALDTHMSEAAFKASLDRVVSDLKTYRDRGRGASAHAGKPAAPKRLRYNPATGELE